MLTEASFPVHGMASMETMKMCTHCNGPILEDEKLFSSQKWTITDDVCNPTKSYSWGISTVETIFLHYHDIGNSYFDSFSSKGWRI